MTDCISRTNLGRVGVGVAILLSGVVAMGADEAAEPLRSDGRKPYVHRLTLYDHDGQAIDPTDEPAAPYSPTRTCGKCHAVGTIRHGWHFSADMPEIDAGRPGEPWLWTDRASGTVLPISGRDWPGTFRPADVGLSRWAFTKRFGHRTPGGGFADPDEEAAGAAEESLRWDISGPLEIDCLACHSTNGAFDPGEWQRQIALENFRWAPTASIGLGVVRGSAKTVPDDYDPFVGPNPDFPEQSPPTVEYDESRFDADQRVLFDITRRPPAENCYACHSTRQVGTDAPPTWRVDGDVHLSSGMTCTDCHRNGIDHRIARGDAEETAYSCKGCHLGSETALGGTYGAPVPAHRGLPPIHLEKLSCTACHSGPWPGPRTSTVQTGFAHDLGIATRERTDATLPRIDEPIFLRRDGQITPHRSVLPRYWAVRHDDGRLQPLPIALVERTARKLNAQAGTEREGAPSASLSEVGREALRSALQDAWDGGGAVTYVAPSSFEPLRGALFWPLAHDVRPAAQSLGVRGCTDCHAAGAPFFFGTVGEGILEKPVRMDALHQGRAWAVLFSGRGVFKAFALLCVVLMILAWLRRTVAPVPADSAEGGSD